MSKAWAPLFELRHKAGVAPLQFAIAGMNAHINHDLALALVATCKELGIGLDEGTPQHGDYIAVNATLEQVQARIKDRSTLRAVPASPGACCSLARPDQTPATVTAW